VDAGRRGPKGDSVETRTPSDRGDPAPRGAGRWGEADRPGAYPREVPKPTSVFSCSACGAQSPKWHGQCPSCGEWNTLAEERAPTGRAAQRPARGPVARPVPLREVAAERAPRLATGIGELDRVLGGGLVPGSLVLLGGSPGIGKSTLTNMALGNLAAEGRATLYVSGEESAAQIRLRAERLGDDALSVPVIAETSLEVVLATLEAERPDVCVVDSVQTLHAEGLSGAAGSVGQVREVAARLERLARECGTTVVLVGHVTKDGALAGPRVLEHAVDCVLQFEGERERSYRVLRALKNRFGATNEVAVFEMRGSGLTEVSDPSARFLRDANPVPGSCMLCAMEGSRALLVEVQALVAPTDVVPPRRIANGIERNRLSLVLAVLSRHVPARLGGGGRLGAADVFVSVAGGVRIEEPGADLAVALAIASAASGAPAVAGARPLACFGEIGLTGELRYVAHAERRLDEAARFGLEGVVAPAACVDAERPGIAVAAPALSDALESAFGDDARLSARAA
jgi:DNA repair protein RadA/Sms